MKVIPVELPVSAPSIICPHCNKDFKVGLKSVIPDDQIVTIKITTTNYIGARTLGETMVNTSKLLKTVAKEFDTKVEVFIKDIRYKESETEIDFIVVKAH